MTDVQILGLVGPAKSGKNAVADALGDTWVQLAFAEPIKQMLYHLNPILPTTFDRSYPMVKRVQDVVDSAGWDKAKKNHEIRELLQRLGTEAGRDVLGEDIWLRILSEKIDEYAGLANYNVVVTDVRFPNEVDLIKRYGGSIVWVHRPGVEPLNAHASEALDFGKVSDVMLLNDGTLEDLERTVQGYLLDLKLIKAFKLDA